MGLSFNHDGSAADCSALAAGWRDGAGDAGACGGVELSAAWGPVVAGGARGVRGDDQWGVSGD